MKTTSQLRAYLALLAATVVGWPAVAAAQDTAYPQLDLATQPLFAGTSAPPNVMVAVDDSGSMDSEVLFPADDGAIYWDRNPTGFTHGGEYNGSGGNLKYVYLFPNGCNSGRSGKRTYCNNTFAIPPIPQFAFARSPQYNAAYFNPSTSYDPWVTMDDSEPSKAWTDPVIKDDRFDLTKDVRESDRGSRFRVGKGMTIPKGYEIYLEQIGGWYTLPIDVRVDDYSQYVNENDAYDNVGFKYFPATFYLKANPGPDDPKLPADYGYTATPLAAKGPFGNDSLRGYEIKPENFSGGQNGAAYKTAIQNFANWFTYYRKRHLATRGGITAAFDRISGMRAGSCTINRPQSLDMKDLDVESDRSEFYNDIFGINFWSGGGTPNRNGLNYLGKQLEQNSSIITAPCQRNFAILFTDGYNSQNLSSSVGNVDKNYGSPFADNYSNTIADVAMKYYKQLDPVKNWQKGLLRVPSDCDILPVDPSLNCEKNLHMVTFGVILGQSGKIYDNPAYTDQNTDPYANPPSWPNPINSGAYGPEQLDDLWHATVNTHGDLLNAKTPDEIAGAFVVALEKILGEEGSASSVSLNSASLTENSTAYQASFVAGAWAGKLKALPQSSDASGFGDPIWEASEKLNTKKPNDRVILTSARKKCDDKYKFRDVDAVPFRYAELNDKCRPTQDELDYIRGDRSNERANKGTFRNRGTNILGDIVDSDPLYVGAPSRFRYPRDWDDFLTDGNDNTPEDSAIDYSNPQGESFAQGPAASRTPMIYVGANDGMLHGFDADSGEEKLAYIPGSVLGNLADLAQPNYAHRYYVDGSPSSGDVVIDDKWHTVLVSGLRGGGRTIFALDITNPDKFSEANAKDIVMWEFEDDELGETYSKPSIVRLHNGDWGAVFGNGYNSCSESAQLFVVDIASGKLIRRIDTGAGPGAGKKKGKCKTDDSAGGDDDEEDKKDKKDKCDEPKHQGHEHCLEGNGLGSNGLGQVFPVDVDGDFITDYVYGGDLYGNMWRFDLTDRDDRRWDVGLDGEPLFTATDSRGNPQPITAQPQVGLHPYGSDYGVMVYFGTGKYLESSDRRADEEVQNSFYGIWDLDVFPFNEADNGEPLFNTGLKSQIPRSRLQEQTILDTVDNNDTGYRLVSDEEVAYQTDETETDGKRGWYIDLPIGQGEMVVSNGRIEGDTVSFSTTIPNTESCAAGGSGFFMLLNRETGGRTDYPAFDLNQDKQFTQADDTFARDGEQIGASGMSLSQGVPGEATHQIDHGGDQAYYIIPTSDGTIRRVFIPKPPDRRRSWREIRR